MNYTNIFSSLETDSKRIVINGDWKAYFHAKPYPDHYKQSWLIKRLMDLEATPHGATILNKDAEIAQLKAEKAELQNRSEKSEKSRDEYKKQIQGLSKKLVSVINESQKRADERISEIQNHYAKYVSVDKEVLLREITNLNKTVASLQTTNQNWRIEAENNWNDYTETWDEMMNAEVKFANLKQKTTQEQEESERIHKEEIDKLIRNQDLDHINFVRELNKLEDKHRQKEKSANDDKETLEKEHAQKLKDLDVELKKANQKLFNLINKPVATAETQTDITADDLTKFTKNAWKNLVVIKDRLKKLSETNILQISGKATQFNKDYTLWLDGYEKKWGDLLTLLDQGERERERERERETATNRPLENN